MPLRSAVSNGLDIQLYSILKTSSNTRVQSPLALKAKHTFFVVVDNTEPVTVPTKEDLLKNDRVLANVIPDEGRRTQFIENVFALNLRNVYELSFPYIDSNKFVSDELKYEQLAKLNFEDALQRLNQKSKPNDDDHVKDTDKFNQIQAVVRQDQRTAHTSSILGMSDAYDNQIISNSISRFNVTSADARFMLKLFCAVHNTLALAALPNTLVNSNSSRHCAFFLRLKRKLIHQQQAYDLAALRTMLWQSLIIKPIEDLGNVHGMDEYLNFDLFSKPAEQNTMNNAIELFKTNGNLSMESAEMRDTGLYFPSHLINKSNASSNRQIQCLDSNNYWDIDNNDNIATVVEKHEVEVNNDECDKFFRNEVLGYDDRTLVLTRPENNLAVNNAIVKAYQNLLPGQVVSWMSNYGTQIDLLVKQFFVLWVKTNSFANATTEQVIEKMKSDLMFFMSDLPEIVYVCSCVILERMLKDYNIDSLNLNSDVTYIDSSKPGFLFGMVYNDGKLIGIHPDTILTVKDDTGSEDKLIVGELKTKWTLTSNLLGDNVDFLQECIDNSTVNDHIHQAMCQGIVSYCMWAKSNELTKMWVHLFALAVPFERTVTNLFETSYIFEYDNDGVAQLCCRLYASMLFTTVLLRNLKAFAGFSDKHFFVPRDSSMMLWVINALIPDEDPNDPSVFPVLLLDPFDLDKTRTLQLPTFTCIASSPVLNEVNVDDEFLNPFVVNLGAQSTWCIPLTAKGKSVRCVLLLPDFVDIKPFVLANAVKTNFAEQFKTKIRASVDASKIQRSSTFCTLTVKVETAKWSSDKPSLFDEVNDSFVCVMLPLTMAADKVANTGNYAGVLLQIEDDNKIQPLEMVEWFDTNVRLQKDVFGQYEALHKTGKTSKILPTCSILAIDDVCNFYSTAGSICFLSSEATTILQHFQYFLRFYCTDTELDNVYSKEWPFNLVRNVVESNQDTITLSFSSKDTNKPASVLAPYKNNGEIFFQIFKRVDNTDEYSRVSPNPLTDGNQTVVLFQSEERQKNYPQQFSTFPDFFVKNVLVDNPDVFKKRLAKHDPVYYWLNIGHAKFTISKISDAPVANPNDFLEMMVNETPVLVKFNTNAYKGLYPGIIAEIKNEGKPRESVMVEFTDGTYSEIFKKDYNRIKLNSFVEHKNNNTDLEHALAEGISLPIITKYFAV